MKVEFLPSAALEATEAQTWYGRRGQELARALGEEIDAAVAAISKRPTAWPRIKHGARRYFMQRFPYALVYVLREERIVVVAVAHFKRRPTYWRHRLPPKQ